MPKPLDESLITTTRGGESKQSPSPYLFFNLNHFQHCFHQHNHLRRLFFIAHPFETSDCLINKLFFISRSNDFRRLIVFLGCLWRFCLWFGWFQVHSINKHLISTNTRLWNTSFIGKKVKIFDDNSNKLTFDKLIILSKLQLIDWKLKILIAFKMSTNLLFFQRKNNFPILNLTCPKHCF